MSRRTKQFVTLLVASAYISGAPIWVPHAYGFGSRTLLLRIFVASLPAILFASVLLWWFSQPE